MGRFSILIYLSINLSTVLVMFCVFAISAEIKGK